jgi:threonine dehydrogenase-like Zn-dependent dehydrogenase
MGAEFCNIHPGDTIAVWGCGPVGQMAIRSCFLLGAERVLAIDTVAERLELARSAGAETLDFLEEDIYDRIQELTHGRGADACIDAVGTEAEASVSLDSR